MSLSPVALSKTAFALSLALASAGCFFLMPKPIQREPYAKLPDDDSNSEMRALYPRMSEALSHKYKDWEVERILGRNGRLYDFVERNGIQKRAALVFWAGRNKQDSRCAVGLATFEQTASSGGWGDPVVTELGGDLRREAIPGYKEADGRPRERELIRGDEFLLADCELLGAPDAASAPAAKSVAKADAHRSKPRKHD
jgi:hypothetical protein